MLCLCFAKYYRVTACQLSQVTKGGNQDGLYILLTLNDTYIQATNFSSKHYNTSAVTDNRSNVFTMGTLNTLMENYVFASSGVLSRGLFVWCNRRTLTIDQKYGPVPFDAASPEVRNPIKKGSFISKKYKNNKNNPTKTGKSENDSSYRKLVNEYASIILDVWIQFNFRQKKSGIHKIRAIYSSNLVTMSQFGDYTQDNNNGNRNNPNNARNLNAGINDNSNNVEDNNHDNQRNEDVSIEIQLQSQFVNNQGYPQVKKKQQTMYDVPLKHANPVKVMNQRIKEYNQSYYDDNKSTTIKFDAMSNDYIEKNPYLSYWLDDARMGELSDYQSSEEEDRLTQLHDVNEVEDEDADDNDDNDGFGSDNEEDDSDIDINNRGNGKRYKKNKKRNKANDKNKKQQPINYRKQLYYYYGNEIFKQIEGGNFVVSNSRRYEKSVVDRYVQGLVNRENAEMKQEIESVNVNGKTQKIEVDVAEDIESDMISQEEDGNDNNDNNNNGNNNNNEIPKDIPLYGSDAFIEFWQFMEELANTKDSELHSNAKLVFDRFCRLMYNIGCVVHVWNIFFPRAAMRKECNLEVWDLPFRLPVGELNVTYEEMKVGFELVMAYAEEVDKISFLMDDIFFGDKKLLRQLGVKERKNKIKKLINKTQNHLRNKIDEDEEMSYDTDDLAVRKNRHSIYTWIFTQGGMCLFSVTML